MAVCLRLAAGGTVAGVGESALRALSKLDQVMPSRLRSQVAAVHDATVTLTSPSSDEAVEPDVLMTLARACRDREHVSSGYVDIRGNATQRRLEPYQLVTTGQALVPAGLRPRQAGLAQPETGPDGRRPRAGQHVRRARCAGRGGLRPKVDQQLAIPLCGTGPLPRSRRGRSATLFTGIGEHRSRRSRRLHRHRRRRRPRTDGLLLRHVGYDFEILEPPEVARAVDAVAERLRRAAGLDSPPAGDPTVGA